MSKRFWGADSVCWILSLARILDGPEPVVLFDMGENVPLVSGMSPPRFSVSSSFPLFLALLGGRPGSSLFSSALVPSGAHRRQECSLSCSACSCLVCLLSLPGLAPPLFSFFPSSFCLSLSLACMQREYLRMVTSRETLMETCNTTDKSFVSPG